MVFLGNEGLGKKEDEVWLYLICYDNFSHLVIEYQRLPQPFSRVRQAQVVHPWWCENIDERDAFLEYFDGCNHDVLTSMDQYDSWRELIQLEKLNDIYKHEGVTYEDESKELMKFLRNVYVHLQETPTTHKIEKDVMTLSGLPSHRDFFR